MKKFSKTEDELLRKCYGRVDTGRIAAALGRSTNSIQQRAFRIGVASRQWTAKENAELLEDYGNLPVGELAVRFGRTRAAVRTHFRDLMRKQRESSGIHEQL